MHSQILVSSEERRHINVGLLACAGRKHECRSYANADVVVTSCCARMRVNRHTVAHRYGTSAALPSPQGQGKDTKQASHSISKRRFRFDGPSLGCLDARLTHAGLVTGVRGLHVPPSPPRHTVFSWLFWPRQTSFVTGAP